MIALAWPLVVLVLGLCALALVARAMDGAQKRDALQGQIDALRSDFRLMAKADDSHAQRIGELELAVRQYR